MANERSWCEQNVVKRWWVKTGGCSGVREVAGANRRLWWCSLRGCGGKREVVEVFEGLWAQTRGCGGV